MRLKTERLLPIVPVLLAPFLLFADVLFTGKALFWALPLLQFVPWRAYALDSLRQGSLPLWNALNGMGAPLLANYQLALFYPPGWLLFLFDLAGGSPAMAWAGALLVALHLSWAGLGIARLLRALGADTLGQTIGGLAFSLCGYFVARAGVYPMIWAGAWLPWLILGVACGDIPGRRDCGPAPLLDIKLILSIALLLLAGHAQVTWYCIVLAAAWALVGGWSRARARGAARAALRLGLAGTVAGLLAAVQLLPTAEYLLESQRSAAVDYQLGLTYSFWPWRILAFFAPDIFGNPGVGTYWGYGAYWEDAVYIGMLPLLLALSSLLVVFRRRGSACVFPQVGLYRFLWIVFLASMFLALGKNTPVFPFLYHHVPTFSLFQAPARWLLPGLLALCLLAGLQTGGWRRPVGQVGRWLRRGMVAAGAVSLGAGAAWLVLRDIDVTFIQSTALAGFLTFASGLLALKMPWPEEETRRRKWSWAVIAFVLVDLVAAGWSLKPGVSSAVFQRGSASASAVRSAVGEGRVYLDPDDEYLIKFWRFFRFANFRALEDWEHIRGTLLPNLNLLDGISSANNFDPLVPARYARLLATLDDLTPTEREPYLRLMGVSLVEQIDHSTPDGVRYAALTGSRRWYWSGCAINAVDGEAAWMALQTHLAALPVSQNPDWVVLEDHQAVQGGCAAEPNTAVIDLIDEQSDRLSFSVQTSAGGWFVLADAWYPGWQVTVDDHTAEVQRANYLFRAVALPAGQHTLVFSYQPFSFRVGAWITALAGVLLLIILVWKSRQRTGKP